MRNTDEDLFREWQQGSAGALEALVQRYHAPLIAHLFRLLGDVHLAEDLAQETFVRLVRATQVYRYPRPFRPWLYTIARRLALNERRRASYRYEEPRAQLPAAALDAPDPAEWLERLEQRSLLQQALAGLSFEQREVLSLRFGEGLDVNETAVLLGIPAGTVKSRTFAALHHLRRYFLAQHERDASGDSAHG